MPNPNPKSDHLLKTAQPRLPKDFKSAPLRIRAHKDAHDAFAALSSEERGEIVQGWYDETEAYSKKKGR